MCVLPQYDRPAQTKIRLAVQPLGDVQCATALLSLDFSEDYFDDAGGREDLHWLSRSWTRTANIVVTLCWE